MRRGVPTPDYSELAVEAVGLKFAMLAHGCSMTELLTYNCMNLIGLGKGIVSVFPALNMEAAMSLCVAIAVGLSAVNDRHFSYIALISAVAILAAEGTCFLGALELPEWDPCQKMGPRNWLGNIWKHVILNIGLERLNPSKKTFIPRKSQSYSSATH